MSWFLYIITESFIDEEGREVKKGEAGVGQCSMSPGIRDAYKGMMYVVPEKYVRDEVRKLGAKQHPSAGTIRKIIENYYNNKEVIEISKDDKDFFVD
tara:strand:- start:1296 stop:1586 length:291 start_codon:yes stop_codon:yes gene_type:complete